MGGLLRTAWWLRILLLSGTTGGLYFASAVVLGMAPVNRNYSAPANGIEFYLTTNGLHAAFVLPLLSRAGNLDEDVPPPSGSADLRSIHVLIGWGDARIYPQTGTWADLTFKNAVSAILGLNGAVMQTLHVARPEPSPRMIRVSVDDEGYRRLLKHIRGSLRRDAYGRAVPIHGASHGRGDAFYQAHGRYHPFNTCNEWVRTGLAAAGVRTAAWSPSDISLFYHLKR